MKPFLALLGVNFKRLLLTSFNMGSSKKKAASGIIAFLVMSGSMLLLSGSYSFLLGSVLAPLGALDIMLAAMTMMAVIFPLMLNIFAAQSFIFSTKDLDIVLSMPVSAFRVMLSRMLALYLEILLMVELFLLPVGISWLYFGGQGGVIFLLLLLVLGVFISFLATTVCLIFGTVISLLVSRMRFKNLFNILFSFLFIALIFTLSFSFGNITAGAETSFESLRASLYGGFPPLEWMVRAVAGGEILLYLALLLGCLVPFLIFTWLFSLFYQRLLTSLASHSMRKNFKLGKVSATGSLRALLFKEARRFFGTPIYMMNFGISGIMAIGLSVFAFTQRYKMEGFLAQLDNVDVGFMFAFAPYVVICAVVLFQSIGVSSGVSVSLEGKTLWILKSSPLPVTYIFASKAGFSFLLNAFTALVSIPFLLSAFSLPFYYLFPTLAIGLLFALATGLGGLFINLLLPRMDAENDTIVVKQSASMLVCMLANMLLIVLLGGTAVLLHSWGWSFILFSVAACVILILLSAIFTALLHTKGRRLFAAL